MQRLNLCGPAQGDSAVCRADLCALFPEGQSFEVTALFRSSKALNKYHVASFSV